LFAKRKMNDSDRAVTAELPSYRSPRLACEARHDSATAPDFRRAVGTAVITNDAGKLAAVRVEIYANVAFRPSKTMMCGISDEF
jgi:hypothetical protein